MAIDAPAVATTTPGAPVAPGVVRPSTAPCPVSEPTTAASGPEENACLLLVSLILSVPVARPAVRRVLDDLSHFPSGLAGLARRMVGRLSTVLGMDFNLPTALLTVAHRHFVNLVSPAWNWLLYPLLGESGPNGPVTVSPALASLYSELAGLLEPLATIPLVGRGSETTPDAERPGMFRCWWGFSHGAGGERGKGEGGNLSGNGPGNESGNQSERLPRSLALF